MRTQGDRKQKASHFENSCDVSDGFLLSPRKHRTSSANARTLESDHFVIKKNKKKANGKNMKFMVVFGARTRCVAASFNQRMCPLTSVKCDARAR